MRMSRSNFVGRKCSLFIIVHRPLLWHRCFPMTFSIALEPMRDLVPNRGRRDHQWSPFSSPTNRRFTSRLGCGSRPRSLHIVASKTQLVFRSPCLELCLELWYGDNLVVSGNNTEVSLTPGHKCKIPPAWPDITQVQKNQLSCPSGSPSTHPYNLTPRSVSFLMQAKSNFFTYSVPPSPPSRLFPCHDYQPPNPNSSPASSPPHQRQQSQSDDHAFQAQQQL